MNNDFVDESLLLIIIVDESILTTRYCLTKFYLNYLGLLFTTLTSVWLYFISNLLGFQPFVILFVLVLLLDILV